MASQTPVSRSQVNRAGRVLRDATQFEVEEIRRSDQILREFRSYHSLPMTKAAMALRYPAGPQARVSQRLKRYDTILDKLRREPGLELGRMQDIGGCRAVLPTTAEVFRVVAHYRRSSPLSARVKRTRDYITDPKESGYRGVHLIVRYDDRDIEIQLRSQLQHEWAFTIETFGNRHGFDLKSGEGPLEVTTFFQMVSSLMAIEESGGVVTSDQQGDLGILRRLALDSL